MGSDRNGPVAPAPASPHTAQRCATRRKKTQFNGNQPPDHKRPVTATTAEAISVIFHSSHENMSIWSIRDEREREDRERERERESKMREIT